MKEFKRKATKKEIENKIIPKYVKLGTSALRLTSSPFGENSSKGEKVYYRDAGIWEVGYKFNKDGVLVSKSSMKHLNNIPLVEITEKEYKKANEGYL